MQSQGAGPAPLVAPFAAEGDGEGEGDRTILDSLRASKRQVRLVGRGRVFQDAVQWIQEPADTNPDHRAMIIHGPGGAGKTRLAGEILQRAADWGWRAGFLSGNLSTFGDWAHLAHPTRPTMIAVDYAEARYDDLRMLLDDAPLEHGGNAPLRLILVIREGIVPSQSWVERLAGGRQLPRRAHVLLGGEAPLVISLDESLPDVGDRLQLWSEGHATYSSDGEEPPDYLADDLFSRPLFVLLDAYRVFAGDGKEGAAPTAEELIRGVLGHEREYWRRSSSEMGLDLDERSMNQVAAVATLTGGVSRPGFEEALEALDWLKDDRRLLLQVTDWWCSIYATESGAVRGLEPDIVGEYLVNRAMGDRIDPRSQLEGSMQAEQLKSLIQCATLVGRQRILRVLIRIANSEANPGESAAGAVLAEILSRHLEEFLPATFNRRFEVAESGTTGEPLAMTVASAVLASDQLQLVANPSSDFRADRKRDERDWAATTMQNAALKVVRRHLDHVSRREFEAGRWTVERFADLTTWALRIDLESDAYAKAEERVAFLKSLTPRPHRSLASLLVEMGRYQEVGDEHDLAETLFAAALEELNALGEMDSALAHSITHDLADVAEHRGDLRLAIERYETAFEGRRGLLGLAHEDTLATLGGLAWALAGEDIDAALCRLDGAVSEMSDSGAEDGQVADVRRDRARAYLAAGRAAKEGGELERAAELYQLALDELEDAGEADAFLAYVITHDLADVAAADGDVELAIQSYESAFEGKFRLLGTEDTSTMFTLISWVKLLGTRDLDAALERIASFAKEVRETRPEYLEWVVEAQIELLANGRRFSEAAEVSEELQALMLEIEVGRAIFDAAADPTTEEVLVFPLAIEGCLLASLIFSPRDSRFLPLASRLSRLVLERASLLFQSQVTMHDMDGFADGALGAVSVKTYEELARSMNEHSADAVEMSFWAVEAAPSWPALFAGLSKRLMEEVRRAAADPRVAALGTAGEGSPAEIAEDRTVRQWLAGTVFEGIKFEEVEFAEFSAGRLLSFYLGLRDGIVQEPPLEEVLLEVWRDERDPERLADAQRQLAGELGEAGDLDGETANHLAAAARASALGEAGRTAWSRRDLPLARKLFERALEEFAKIGERESVLGCMFMDNLGDVAAGEGDDALATRAYRSAFEGLCKLRGLGSPTALQGLRSLTAHLARRNLDDALAQLNAAMAELVEAGAANAEIASVRRAKAGAMMEAGRVAAAESDYRRAPDLFRAALEELEAVGEEDTVLAYVITHELANAVAWGGDPASGIAHYEAAIEGKTRLRGATHESTLVSIWSHSALLARDDLEGALSRLDAAAAALTEAGADDRELVALGQARATALLEAGRVAEKDASTLFRRGLKELEAIGKQDSDLAFVLMHELACALDEERHFAAGLELHRTAFEGLRRLNGLTGPGVIALLEGLAQSLAREDPDEALALLGRAAGELVEADADETQVAAVRRSTASLLREQARTAKGKRDLLEAIALYERAQSELEGIGEKDTPLTYLIAHDHADASLANGDVVLALQRYETAWEGKRRLYGIAHPSSVGTLLALAKCLAHEDLDAALDRLDAVKAELEEAGAGEERIVDVRRGRALALIEAGRLVEGTGDLSLAARHFERAAKQLAGLGEQDTVLSYVIAHDLANLAAAEGDTSRAARLYRDAFEGKKRLLGPADANTIGTLLRLAEALEQEDAHAAGALLSESIEELVGLDGAETSLRAVRRARASTLLLAGRNALDEGDVAGARDLFEQALEDLDAIGETESSLAYKIVHDLATVAAKDGDRELARKRYEAAHEGLKRVSGAAERNTIQALLNLANHLDGEPADFDAASALLEQEVAELIELGAPDDAIVRVQRHMDERARTRT